MRTKTLQHCKSSLARPNRSDPNSNAARVSAANAVTQQDVDLICGELDVSEDVAVHTLRNAAVELGLTKRDGDALVVAALRKLVTS